MREETAGAGAPKHGIEGAVEKAKEFAGAAAANVGRFVRSLGARIAGLFKGSN